MLTTHPRDVARACGHAFGQRGFGALEQLEPRMAFSTVAPDNHTIVRFETTYGPISIELFDDTAPITVTNFLTYVNDGRLDGTFFHRMVHEADGGIDIFQGGSFYFEDQVPPVPPQDVVTDAPIVLENTGHANVAGTIAMARQSDPNTATSGFFFNVRDNPGLDYRIDGSGNPQGYAVFGRVVNGLNVLEVMFSQARTNAGGAFTNLPVTDHFTEESESLTEADLIYLHDANVVDRARFRTDAGSAVAGAVNPADVLIISSLGADGSSQVFLPLTGAVWQYNNLSVATGAPAVTGNLVVFYDPATGLKNAVGPSAAGVILFTQSAEQAWSFRNLTAETGGLAIDGKLTVFTSTDGRVHAAGVTDAGHVVLYRQTGTGSAWEFRDITTQDLDARAVATPTFVGDLTSYVTSWNGLNIVGLDADGEIQVVWWSPGIDQNLWTTSNLSEITGAPRLTGGLTVYLTSWQATNIVGITQDGHVSVTWWLPSFGGNWNKDDLTLQTGGPNLVASSITSYVTGWGATNVAGLDADGKLWVYWWTPDFGTGGWQFNDLIAALPAGTKPMVGQITGVTSTGPTINLVGSAANGDVMRFSWNATDGLGWLDEDVSYLASLA